MKRIGLIIAAVALALLAVAVAVPLLVPEKTIRVAVAREIQVLTGRMPAIAGDAGLRILPFPSVSVERLSLPGLPEGSPLLQADRLDATLRLSALLLGRIEIASVALRKARLDLSIDRGGKRSWGFTDGVLARAAKGDHSIDLPLGSLRFVDGRVAYEDARSGIRSELVLADAGVNWSKLGRGLSASGVVGWRGQSMDLSVELADPDRLLSGGSSEFRGRLGCDLGKIAANGNLDGDGRFEGKLDIASQSLRDVLQWAGVDIADDVPIADFKLQSPATIDGGSLSFPAAEIEVDGNVAEGAVSLNLNGARPKLSGTLDAESFDLTPYVRARAGRSGDGGVEASDAPIDLELLSLGDVDLRLSASETTIGNAKFGPVAAAAVAREGTLEISLGEAAGYGGTVSGRMTVDVADSLPRVKGSLTFENIEMNQALGGIFAFHRLEGSGRGQLDVTMSGTSTDAMLQSASGQANFTVVNGSLSGIDLVEMMRRIERRPLSIGFEPRSGRTSFDKMSASFAIDHGVAQTRDAKLDDKTLSVNGSGQTVLSLRTLDLDGSASLVSAADSGEPFSLPFKVRGTWEWPIIELDPDALIRRSGAAAPLLQRGVSAYSADGVAKPAAAPALKSLTP